MDLKIELNPDNLDVDTLGFELTDIGQIVRDERIACIQIDVEDPNQLFTREDVLLDDRALDDDDNRCVLIAYEGPYDPDDPGLEDSYILARITPTNPNMTLEAEHGNTSDVLGQIQIWVFDAKTRACPTTQTQKD